MARLNESVKCFVVARLACFRTPTQVAGEVKEVFDLDVSRQRVHYYDPTSTSAPTPKKWEALFVETRRAYLEEQAQVGVAHQRYRLEQLQELLDRALSMGRAGNIPLALSILEQAAKETGGVYTNRHKLEHSGQVKTTGVLLLPGEAALGDWGKAAREQQAQLERDAAAAVEAVVGRVSAPRAGARGAH